MRKLKRFLSRLRFVYRRSSNLTKCVVIVTLLLSTAVLLALRAGILQNQRRIDALEAMIADYEQEHAGMEKDIENKDTVDGVKKFAYEYLDLMETGSVIFEPEQDSAQD